MKRLDWTLFPTYRPVVSFSNKPSISFKTEPLVLHSRTYRTAPPLSHEEFVAKVKEWIDKGAAIPDK